MDIDLRNAADYGVLPGDGSGERNSAALQRAVDELEAAGGGTLIIPWGVYEFNGAVTFAVNTDVNCSGTIRVTGDRMPTLLLSADGNAFAVTEAAGALVGRVVFEGLQFQGNLEAPVS